MAESLDKKYLLVDECKWTTQENGKTTDRRTSP